MQAESWKVLEELKGKLDVVVDVGAGYGSFAIRAAEHGAGLVYAFEPDPDKFKRLSYNIVEFGHWGTVVPMPFAVSRETEPQPLMLDQTTQVRTMGLWRFLGTLTHRVNLLRLNMQGSEWFAFCAHPQQIFYALAKVDYIVMHANLLETGRVSDDEWVPKGDAEKWVIDMLVGQGFDCNGDAPVMFRQDLHFRRIYDSSHYLKSHGVQNGVNVARSIA